MKRIKLSKDLAMEALADQNYAKLEVNTDPQQQIQMEMGPNSPEMNPLENDLILDTLFAFCSAKTLANCRLVCRQWKNVSLKAWRNKARVSRVYLGDKRAADFCSLKRYLNLLQFQDDVLQLRTYPFKNFVIQSSYFNWFDGLDSYLEDDAKPISDIARHVIIQDYDTPYSKMKKFLSKFTSLEVLELENSHWDWDHDDYQVQLQTSKVKRVRIFRNTCHNYIRNCEGFLRCFQNLEVLSIEDCTLDDYGCSSLFWIRGILDTVKTIRAQRADAMNLKELEVIFYPTKLLTLMTDDDDIIEPIVGCQFPLERLTIHIVWGKDALKAQVHPIYHLLESYKETLRYLNMSYVFLVSLKMLKLYLQRKETTLRMDALKQVHLSNGLWGMNLLAGLDLPNIEKLVVDSSKCSKEMDKEFNLPRLSFPEGRVYGSLKNLEFLDIREIPGLKTIRAFAKIMPNLTHLTMPLDKHTFEIVCQQFKGLITLNVLAAHCRYEQLDDESFTGISNENGVKSPNITDLALLTHLSVECEKENAAFTDHSVVYGLLQVVLLRSLSICFKELSDGNKLKLMNHVKGYVNIQVKTPSRS